MGELDDAGAPVRNEDSVMKARFMLILCGLLSMGGFAAAQDVKYNYDPTVDFTKYHS